MASFDSPLGSKKMSGQPMREFTVPDESGFVQESVNPAFRRQQGLSEESFQRMPKSEEELVAIEKEMREARKAKATGKEKLNDGAKRRLEMLLNMTKTTHSVDLDGNTYMMRTISSKEMREAYMAISEFDLTVQASLEARRQFLARSLIQVAGVDFEQFIGTDSLDAKLEFVDALDEALLNRLYSEYLEMSTKAKNKYAIKSEEEVKEVIEDLKK